MSEEGRAVPLNCCISMLRNCTDDKLSKPASISGVSMLSSSSPPVTCLAISMICSCTAAGSNFGLATSATADAAPASPPPAAATAAPPSAATAVGFLASSGWMAFSTSKAYCSNSASLMFRAIQSPFLARSSGVSVTKSSKAFFAAARFGFLMASSLSSSSTLNLTSAPKIVAWHSICRLPASRVMFRASLWQACAFWALLFIKWHFVSCIKAEPKRSLLSQRRAAPAASFAAL
mmetsp:Transcript_129765/g.224166  ORF Transcript_129765/g.224166 Transcript_129765/m.224166 type:complete len:234 (-) Transcript_129765:70-771(-)